MLNWFSWATLNGLNLSKIKIVNFSFFFLSRKCRTVVVVRCWRGNDDDGGSSRRWPLLHQQCNIGNNHWPVGRRQTGLFISCRGYCANLVTVEVGRQTGETPKRKKECLFNISRNLVISQLKSPTKKTAVRPKKMGENNWTDSPSSDSAASHNLNVRLWYCNY